MLRRLLNLFRAARLEAEIREEIEFHRERSSGSFGNATLIADRMRDASTIAWLETFLHDVRYGLRQLLKSPVLLVAAVLSLALGIGANTAIFSFVDALMFKSLPVRDPGGLRIMEWSSSPGADMPFRSYDGDCDNTGSSRVCGSFSYPFFKAAHNLPQFSTIFGFAAPNAVVARTEASELAAAHFVTGNYFRALGVNATLGRTLTPSDDDPSHPPVAVLGHRYWVRHFAANPALIGRSILVNNRPATIAGIAPDSFHGLDPGEEPDVYLAVGKTGELAVEWFALDKPDYWWLNIFARLALGVSEEQARFALNGLFANQGKSYSGKNVGAISRVELESGSGGISSLRRRMALTVAILGTAVALVLLIACSNLANLLLARAQSRRREIAVRFSLGASRARLVRQLLTEGLLLSLAGGALGLLLARPLLYVLLTSNRNQPLSLGASVDLRALVFAFLLSVAAGLLFTTLPALRATGLNLGPALKDGALGGTGATTRLRLARLLIALQVALSLVLLVGAGLFVRTLAALATVPLGFHSENILTFTPMRAFAVSRARSWLGSINASSKASSGCPACAPWRSYAMVSSKAKLQATICKSLAGHSSAKIPSICTSARIRFSRPCRSRCCSAAISRRVTPRGVSGSRL